MADQGTDAVGAPASWIHRDPTPEEIQSLEVYLASELGFIEGMLDYEKMADAANAPYFELDLYQQYFLSAKADLFICNKCRQSGGSFMLGLKATARGQLADRNYKYIFTSYKKEEAINKITYVRQFLEAMPPRFKKKIIRDPLQLIEFENPNGTRATIMSHAQKEIRGINGDIGLDELAFYQWADKVYDSALPATAQVNGSIDIVSTPFGKSGKFYEIFSDKANYPDYMRLPIMWWAVTRYLKENSIEFLLKAKQQAPLMTPEERVDIFGNEKIRRQFLNARDLETFQQEFEGYFVDEQAAFFSKDLIHRIMYSEGDSIDGDYNPREYDLSDLGNQTDAAIDNAFLRHDTDLTAVERKFFKEKDNVGRPIELRKYDDLQDLYAAIRRGRVSKNLFVGVDVGTTRNASHVVVLEEFILADGSTLQVERFSLNRSGWDLPDQLNFYHGMLAKGVFRKMIVDVNGVGMHIGQELQKKWPTMFIPFVANNARQEEVMTNLKSRMESIDIALAYDKTTMDDIYSIERHVSDTRKVSFKADDKKRHHADAAWAIAFASWAGTKHNKQVGSMTSLAPQFNLRTSSPLDKPHQSVNPDDPKPPKATFGGITFTRKQLSSGLESAGLYIPDWDS